MVDVTTSVVIFMPAEKVAVYAFDPDHAPEWYANIKSVEWKSPRPLDVNTRVAFVAHFLGKRLSYTYQVMELSRTTLVMKTSEGPFPMETRYQVDALGSAITRMTLQNKGSPTGFSKLAAPFMAMMMRRANEKDLNRLKIILESSYP